MKRLFVALIGLGLNLSIPGVLHAQVFVFESGLSGAQETSPAGGVTTETSGSGRIVFSNAVSQASYMVIVQGASAVTQAHLHCAPAGESGPIVAFLFNTAPIAGPGGIDVDGLLASDVLTNDNIVVGDFANNSACQVTVNNIASLLSAALAGRIYFNVHTEANSSGEIRGQLIPTSVPLIKNQ